MKCEINPAVFDDVKNALEAVGLWSYVAGMLTGLLLAAPLAWLISEAWHYYQSWRAA